MTEAAPLVASYPRAFKSAYYVEEVTIAKDVLPTWDAHIKIDYDNDRNPLQLSKSISTAKFFRKSSISVYRVVAGRSRKGWHIRLWIDPPGPRRWPPPKLTLKIQAMLGDDPWRQEFNLDRVLRKREGFNVLFTHKYHNGKLTGLERFDRTMTERLEEIFLTAETRFWSKVDKRGEDECWPWKAAVSSSGYGNFYVGKRNGKKIYMNAHCYAFEITKGPLKDEGLHSCDFKICCNPRHVFDGTQKENVHDARDKGRLNPAVGEDSGASILTESDVIEMRKLAANGMPMSDVAIRFLTSKENARAVVTGRTWKHVPGALGKLGRKPSHLRRTVQTKTIKARIILYLKDLPSCIQPIYIANGVGRSLKCVDSCLRDLRSRSNLIEKTDDGRWSLSDAGRKYANEIVRCQSLDTRSASHCDE